MFTALYSFCDLFFMWINTKQNYNLYLAKKNVGAVRNQLFLLFLLEYRISKMYK
jgi:hypothetical protein